MPYIQDSTQSFTIYLTAFLEGIGAVAVLYVHNYTRDLHYTYDVGLGIWTPGLPEAVEADSIEIEAEIRNDGATIDTIYGEFVSAEVTPIEDLIQEAPLNVGVYMRPSWSFTMPPNAVNITINAGHVEQGGSVSP